MSPRLPRSSPYSMVGGVAQTNDDIVVAVMGSTGVGKSSLIKLLTENKDIVIGHGLTSETSDVQSYTLRHKGIRYILVDTPGFDDTYRKHEDIVTILLRWLHESYQEDKLLNGVIYIHRLSEPRMQGSALENLRLFRQLCGNEALKNVILAGAFWEGLDPEMVDSRERELRESRDFWGRMIDKGSDVRRLGHGDRKSGLEILEQISRNSKIPLSAQKKMAQNGLDQTVSDTIKSAFDPGDLDRMMSATKQQMVDNLKGRRISIPRPNGPVLGATQRSPRPISVDPAESTRDIEHEEELKRLKAQLNKIQQKTVSLRDEEGQIKSPKLPTQHTSGVAKETNAKCSHKPSKFAASTCGRCGVFMRNQSRYYHCCSCSSISGKICYLQCAKCGSQCNVIGHSPMGLQTQMGLGEAFASMFGFG